MLQVIEDTADPSDPFGPFGPFSCRRPAPRPNSTLRAAGRGRLARRGLWTAHLTGVLALWRGALLPFVATRVALVLVGLLANFYILPLMGTNLTYRPLAENTRLPDALWLMWQRFDSGFYLALARDGYGPVTSLHHASSWVFYPLFPLLVRPVAYLFGGSAMAFDLAGVLVANAAALIAVIFLYKLVARELGARIASRSVLYLAVFPTSFYLSAVYAESLFLACSVACLYYTRLHRWLLA